MDAGEEAWRGARGRGGGGGGRGAFEVDGKPLRFLLCCNVLNDFIFSRNPAMCPTG